MRSHQKGIQDYSEIILINWTGTRKKETTKFIKNHEFEYKILYEH